MEDTTNTNTNTNPGAGEKTFSQEEVNRIVGERLAKEKAKGEATLAEREQQITQRELMLTAKEKINEMGLPAELLDALNVSSSEAMEKSLTTVKTVFDKYKAEAKPFKFRGMTLASPDRPAPGSSSSEDTSIRKAMGLPK